MMSRSPAARYQTAKEVAEVLATWLAGRARGATGDTFASGRPQGAGRPLPPPRRSGTAVSPPPRREKTSKTNDTLPAVDNDTIKSAPPGRPQPRAPAARRADRSG